MKSKKVTFLLTLSALIFFVFCCPALADDDDDDCSDPNIVEWGGVSMEDSDCDGVPDEIEDGVPGLLGTPGDGNGDFTADSQQSGVASFTNSDDVYMTAVILYPDPELKFENVATMDSLEGFTFSNQAAESVPFEFIKFDVIGAPEYQPFTVALILNGDAITIDPISDMVRYGSSSCITSLDDPVFDYAAATVSGPFVNIFLSNGQEGDPNCPPKDRFTFIGAPAIGKMLDTDGDGILIFDDNCPDNANADQEDADDDGIGDACDACPADPDNDIDGDGICGDVDNCPVVSNFKQADANFNGTGDACDVVDETTVYSYIGKRYWRFFRDYDVWKIKAKAGQHIEAIVKAVPEEAGYGKKLNLFLIGRTRGAYLLRIDRSTLDPDNRVEALIPKDGTYWIVIGQSFSWRHAKARSHHFVYALTLRGDPEILDSLHPGRSVGKWWD